MDSLAVHPCHIHLHEWEHLTSVDVSFGGVVFGEIDNVIACVTGVWQVGDEEPAWRIGRIRVGDIRRGNTDETYLIAGDPWFDEMHAEIIASRDFQEACGEHARCSASGLAHNLLSGAM